MIQAAHFWMSFYAQKKLNELIIQGQQPIVETRGK
jgi:hypothetical protein